MNLLIISDNDSNQLYSSIEEGSIGFFPNICLEKKDYNVIKNSDTNILGLITNDKGLGKLFFASLKKVENNNNFYDLTYVILHVIEQKDDIANFNRAFPFAFKDENNAKLSTSKELVKIVSFFSDEDNAKKRVVSCDIKSIIMNTDAYRLQSAKTEVFKKDFEDGVHSRLSHSVRVIHIANQIAKRIQKKVDIEINFDLIEEIAMSLNIGHTPYGNVGEKVIGEILRGDIELIPNVNMLGLKYFKHNLQSARMLERVESTSSRVSNCISMEVIAGIIAHSRIGFKDDLYNDPNKINEYLSKYYINHDNLIGEYAKLKDNALIPSTLEAQIVTCADEIAQKTYDVELAIRSDVVEKDEIITRLKLLSEVTGEYIDYDLNTRNERYYSSREISAYIVKCLVESVSDSFKFEVYNKSNQEIDQYVSFLHVGKIILEMIDNYFQSKLLLSRKVRLYDHKSRQIIKDIFSEVYNDINILPDFHKNKIIDEFKKEGIKDVNILLCFISFEDGKKYLNKVLYSDLSKIKNKQEQALFVKKREIVVQAIIDYIVYLSDNDARTLHKTLVFN